MENKFCLDNVNVLDNFFDKIDIQIMKFILKKTHDSIDLCDNLFFFEYLKHKIEIFYKNEFSITVLNVSANMQPGIKRGSFCGESNNNEFLFCIYLTECKENDEFSRHFIIKPHDSDFIRLIEQKDRRKPNGRFSTKSWIELLSHMCLEGAESLRPLYVYKKIDQSSNKLLQKFG